VLKKIPVTDINDANDAHAEARELRFLQHPRIVGYEDDFMHVTPSSAGRDGHIFVCIIMEHCERDMRVVLEEYRNNGQRFSEDHLLRYLTQLCSALAYCHSKQIIHRGMCAVSLALAFVVSACRGRGEIDISDCVLSPHHVFCGVPSCRAPDIKPQNVFLDADDNVRLGDFGLCRPFRTAFTSFTDAGTDCCACCVLRAACCVLRAACCVLRAACCVLRAACCMLRVHTV